MTDDRDHEPDSAELDEPTVMRNLYRYLREHGVHTDADAYAWLTCTIELGRAGWTLNADETDWLPPSTEETDHE